MISSSKVFVAESLALGAWQPNRVMSRIAACGAPAWRICVPACKVSVASLGAREYRTEFRYWPLVNLPFWLKPSPFRHAVRRFCSAVPIRVRSSLSSRAASWSDTSVSPSNFLPNSSCHISTLTRLFCAASTTGISLRGICHLKPCRYQ